MNLIILTAADFIADDYVRLTDERFSHIRDIHKSGEGKQVRVGLLNGKMGTGTIITLTESHLEMRIELFAAPPEKLPLSIILALPRPKMIRRIFRSVAELGVAELIIINSYKVEKSFWQSPVLAEQKVTEYLIAGLQQSRDTVLPKVSFKRLFKPFIEDELPELIADKQALIAHPATGQPCPMGLDKPTVLAIGPEGGFTPYEVDKFIAAGFSGIHLGPRILRVENALTALVSKLYQ